MKKLLGAGSDPVACVSSWKGSLRAYHDFDHQGKIVEVKSTISKEPRRVQINNERQLDNTQLVSLHLYVVTFQENNAGRSLAATVQDIRARLQIAVAARSMFDRCLVSAGYLDIHEHFYNTGYLVILEELFLVGDGFPRIIDLPDGVGDLRYSIVLGACQSFKCAIGDFIMLNIQEKEKCLKIP